jgi:hypothetical protein
MRKATFFKTMLAAVMLLVGSAGVSAQLLVENFEYSSGSLLTSNGWTNHSGTAEFINVVVPGLEFTGYAGSGVGGAANLDNNGEDVHRTFAEQTTGTVYAAFIIKTEATNAAGYFFHFGQTTISTTFFTRIWVNATGDGVAVGSYSGTTIPASFVPITAGTPTLIVVKLDIATKLSSLYVLNTFAASEPASANQTFTETATFTNVGSVALRQYNTAQRIIVDGIRVATSWAQAVAPASGTPKVSTPYFDIAGDVKATDTYWNSAAVTIGTTTEGAAVYYTTNGSAPTTTSTLFTTPINITSTTTFKALAVKSGLDNSVVAERTITIAPPASATVPYTEAFNNTLGDWYAYMKAGAKPWTASANGAYANGFGGGDVESWLISPKFTSPLAGLAFSFNHASRYVGNPLLVKYSTNYTGFGDPAAATWTDLTSIAAPTEADINYTVKASGDIIVPVSGNVHLALVYDTEAAYSDWRITNASVVVAPAANTPTITVTEISVPALSAEVGASDAKDITVSGVNLTGNITLSISGANANYFSASPASIAHVSGSVSDVTVSLTYSPLAAGSHSATLTLSSPGAANVTRTLTGTATSQMTLANVIITEVYGGGGNSGATLKNDFIELYNTTTTAINISGWSIQYYSATGTGLATNVFVIPEGKSIPAKGYFLVQAVAGTGGTDDLPTPDAVSTLALSGSAGKVILYTNETAQTISDIASLTGNAAFKDYVPFGTTAVPVWGSAMAANTTNTTSATRKMVSNVFSYTQNIGFDFELATPSPTNSMMTSIRRPEMRTDVYVVNGSIRFNATAGELVEVYNVIGQKLINSIANDGLNTIPVPAKGMMVVKIGNKTAKVIL